MCLFRGPLDDEEEEVAAMERSQVGLWGGNEGGRGLRSGGYGKPVTTLK